MRLLEGRLRPRLAATVHRLRVASTLSRVDPAVRADRVVLAPVDPVAPAVLVSTDLVDLAVLRVDLVDLVGLVAPVDLVSTDLVDLAVLRVDLVGPVGLVGLADRDTPADTVRVVPAAQVDRAVLGTATTNAATSMAPRGATGLALGGTVRLLVRPGIDRCHLQEARGTTARSTTTATRRRPSGIPDLTSLASTSSECGSRCNKPPTTPASPHGEAGVVGWRRQTARSFGTL
jgi:hypothetical protein